MLAPIAVPKKLIQCDGSSCDEISIDEASPLNVADTCTAGVILTGKTEFCAKNAGEGMEISSSTGNGYYLITVSSVLGSGQVLVKKGEDAVIAEEVRPGYYLNKLGEAESNQVIKCTGDSSTTCTTITISKEKCTDKDVKVGDVVLSEGKISVCLDTTVDTNVLEIEENYETTTYHNVQLKNNGTPYGSADTEVLLEKGNNYVVLYAGGTTPEYFTSAGVKSNEKDFKTCSQTGSIIKYTFAAGAISLKRKCVKPCNPWNGCDEGYYLVEEDDTTKLVTEDGKEGKLYQCSGSCTEIKTDIPIGYLVNAGNVAETDETDLPYISCKKEDDKVVCRTINVSSEGPCDSIGGLLRKIIGTEYVYHLCVKSTGNGQAIHPDATKVTSYVIDVQGECQFDDGRTDSFVVVNVDHGHATLDKSTTGLPKYHYTDTNYKVYNESCTDPTKCEERQPVCDPSKTIWEFEYQEDIYYSKNKPNEWPSS